MNPARHAAPLAARSWVAALAAVLALASCATGLRVAGGVEPERYLPPGAIAYLKLDAPLSALLVEGFAGEGSRESARAVAERLDGAVVAVADAGADGPALYAVATGRFPAALGLALSGDRGWTRDGPVWSQEAGPLSLARTSDGRLFLGTAGLGPMLEAAAEPGDFPVPEPWRGAWGADVALYAPRPIASLGSRYGLDASMIPMLALVLAADAAGARYDAEISFSFADGESAVMLAPLCRVFLLAVARGAWPSRAADILRTAAWRSAEGTVTASGLSLSADELAAFFAMAGLGG